MIPKNITRKEIIDAIDYMDKNDSNKYSASTRYDLIYNNKTYPPKEIIRFANKFAGNSSEEIEQFSGGDETNNFLEERGFKVISKNISENNKFKILFFKYDEKVWGKIEEIKSHFQKEKFYFQSNILGSYGVEIKKNDTVICMNNNTKQILFLCKIREPFSEGKFDYINPLFFKNPINYDEIFDKLPYIQFKPKNYENSLTLAVIFDLTYFPEYINRIKKILIEKNHDKKIEIEKYFIEKIEPFQIDNFSIKSKNIKSENKILYGPPGTGKTFTTKQRAIEIIENGN